MPNVIFNDVTLAFTQNMTRESDFGGYNYSFIINKKEFCDKVRAALEIQKTQVWAANKNTDTFILQKCNAKSKDAVTHEGVSAMMGDDDILMQVKSKVGPIANTKNAPLGRGTIADILVDVFEYEYGKKQFICVRSHSDRGITVKVKDLKEYSGGVKYFDIETDANTNNNGVNTEALDEIPF
jgi:hypothetical protein